MTDRQINQPGPGNHAELSRRAIWRKSSYSGTQGNCVEVATNLPDVVAVRDSKDPAGSVVITGRAEWVAFIAHLQR